MYQRLRDETIAAPIPKTAADQPLTGKEKTR